MGSICTARHSGYSDFWICLCNITCRWPVVWACARAGVVEAESNLSAQGRGRTPPVRQESFARCIDCYPGRSLPGPVDRWRVTHKELNPVGRDEDRLRNLTHSFTGPVLPGWLRIHAREGSVRSSGGTNTYSLASWSTRCLHWQATCRRWAARRGCRA